MQTLLRPWQSAAHRHSSIALYRTLLAQCNKLPDQERKHVLRNVVRNTFRENLRMNSHIQLRAAFNDGYDILNLLDEVLKGDASSLSELNTILTDLSTLRQARPHLSPSQRRNKRNARPKGPAPGRLEDRTGILSRPYPIDEASLTKPRQVPGLIVTSPGFPFLRYGKPQPQMLSSQIAHVQKRFEARTDARQNLETKMAGPAKWEDAWDEIIRAEFGPEVADEGRYDTKGWPNEPDLMFNTWFQSVRYGVDMITKDMKAMLERGKETYHKMNYIVEQERELAEEEKRILRARRERENISNTNQEASNVPEGTNKDDL